MNAVTCHTPGCFNNGISIDMQLTWTELDEWGEEVTTTVGGVVCGPCGHPIDDIVPPLGESREDEDEQPEQPEIEPPEEGTSND